VYPLLDAMAALLGRLMRLFVDLHVRDHKPSECKRLYIARYGITARCFNALAYGLKGPVAGGLDGTNRAARPIMLLAPRWP